MKITSLDVFPIRMVPVKPGFADHQPPGIETAGNIIVRINTDKGLSGLGEVASSPAYFNQTHGALLDWLRGYAAALEGADPLNIIKAHKIMDRVSGENAPGCHPARGGIDLALHDLMGKAYGCPVYKLLGGAHRTEFTMLTNLYEVTPEAKAAAAREYVDKGFKGLKIKIGYRTTSEGINPDTIRAETEKLIAALEAVPSDIYIDADPNQSWGNAKIVVRAMEAILSDKFYPNLSIEAPIHHLDFQGHKYLREKLRIPVLMDETVVSPAAMLQIVRHEAADRIVLKHCRVGGLLPAMKIVAICEAAWIGISIDTMPFTRLGDTANCHLAAAIRDPYPVDVEGHTWFADTPIRGGLEIANGRASIGDAPGFGVEIDEDKLASMLIRP
jgi:L-alanine-DL-glutamate epimerase-like enolase superfamily enzyme